VTADFALVLNAGSSSLKFCLFRRPKGLPWELDAKGQIEGMAAPRLSVKDGVGSRMKTIRERGRGAVNAWLPGSSNITGESVGVGHRVVHGGARRPNVVNQGTLAQF
jgi:acetate kinase